MPTGLSATYPCNSHSDGPVLASVVWVGRGEGRGRKVCASAATICQLMFSGLEIPASGIFNYKSQKNGSPNNEPFHLVP